MQPDNIVFRNLLSKDLMDALIRVGLIALVVFLCVRVIAPFAWIMLWALILGIALYPLHQGLARRLGGQQGYTAIFLVAAALLLIGLPTVILGSSFAEYIFEKYSALANDTLTIRQPDPTVADWPLIGKKVYSAWSAAATDLPGYLKKIQPQLGNITKHMLAAAASTAGDMLAIIGSLIIAGIMMAYGESGNRAMQRIFTRLAGSKEGPRLHRLTTATVRSVATGVVGVAFIQALLLGIGFILAGIPAAGVLAVVVLLLGILQLPVLIVSLPAIGYLWWAGDASTTSNIVFTVYLLIAGLADNVLKPILLGRGVDVPMPVVLLGALGGMVTNGIIGLFVGAVLLAVGYQIFMTWVDQAEQDINEESEKIGVPNKAAPTGD